jgi:hypothetical protein
MNRDFFKGTTFEQAAASIQGLRAPQRAATVR